MINVSKWQPSEENLLPFETGEIVSHKRYEYRGVIVHRDNKFQGDEKWYLSNQTQPGKKQPWYFVLIDDNQQVTYVAETNLTLDNSPKEVNHPMVNLFFSGYDNELKKYIRNEVPWNPGNPPETPPPSPPPNFQPSDKPPNLTPPDSPDFL